jgi:hypothetical protein
MSVKGFLGKRIASMFKLDEAYEYLQLSQRIGQPCKVDIPPDLIPMAGKMFMRAVSNQAAFEVCRDWVLPYWAQRQFTPGDPAFIPRMNRSSFNLTHRNWSAVGLVGSTREPIIDERGLVTPLHEGWSVDFWLESGGTTVFPSKAESSEITQEPIEDLPLIATRMKADQVNCKVETFAAQVGGVDVVVMRAVLKNTGETPKDARLLASIRPYNPEGLVPIRKIEYTEQGGFFVNGALGLYCMTPPSGVYCCDFRSGDCSHFIDKFETQNSVNCEVGLATAFGSYNVELGPGQVAERVFLAPMTKVQAPAHRLMAMSCFDMAASRDAYRAMWRGKVEQGMCIDVPNPKVNRAFALHKTYLNLMDDGSYITPGPSLYHHYWFRDSAYLITALNRLGFADQARDKLLSYPSRQKKDGFFLSQDGEWDSNGQAIWTLVEHYRNTGDRDFLNRMLPAIVRGAKWFAKKTEETKAVPSPHYGLLPAGMSAEHFGPNDFFYWDDLWGLAGLRDAAWAARELGADSEAEQIDAIRRDLEDSLNASLKTVEERLGERLLPAGPHRRMDSGAIGGMCAVYPLSLYSPDDPLIENTVRFLRERCFFDRGFFQDMTHAGINAYLTFHVAQTYVLAKDQEAWELIDYLMSLASSTFIWPEAIHPSTGGGSMGDGMHGWATADFLLLIRNTLLHEQGNRLLIAPCIPESWTDWGRHVTVTNAPTHFGSVTFSIEGRMDALSLTIDPQWRKSPEKIEWVLPFEAKNVQSEGGQAETHGRSIILEPGVFSVKVERPSDSETSV